MITRRRPSTHRRQALALLVFLAVFIPTMAPTRSMVPEAVAIAPALEVRYFEDSTMLGQVGGSYRDCQGFETHWGYVTPYVIKIKEPCLPV